MAVLHRKSLALTAAASGQRDKSQHTKRGSGGLGHKHHLQKECLHPCLFIFMDFQGCELRRMFTFNIEVHVTLDSVLGYIGKEDVIECIPLLIWLKVRRKGKAFAVGGVENELLHMGKGIDSPRCTY